MNVMGIRKVLLLVLALAGFAALEFAQASAPISPIQTAGQAAPFSLAHDWRVLSISLAFLTVILIALAAMFAHSFEMPELKAWATTELGQVFATAIIIIAFAGMITFLDVMVGNIVNGSKLGFTCTDTQNCAITTADKYIQGLVDLTEEASRTVIKDSNAKAQSAYRSYGGYCTSLISPIPCLQASTSFSTSAGNLMHVERYGVVLEYLGNLLSVLYSQKYFVDVISFRVAPAILMIGIVARSFFVTRKLGGLLIAVGIGVMYVFPLMYVFNWLTLNITIFGDSAIDPSGAACPAACLLKPPKFFSSDASAPILYSKDDTLTYLAGRGFAATSVVTAQRLPFLASACTGSVCRGTAPVSSTKTVGEHINELDAADPASGIPLNQWETFQGNLRITNCEANQGCPIECREIPYPITQTCKEAYAACSIVDPKCKIIRYVNPLNPTAQDRYNDGNNGNGECPTECRSRVPLQANCGAAGTFTEPRGRVVDTFCTSSADFCKFTRLVDGNPNALTGERPEGCDANATACPQSITPAQSCVWVLPSRQDIDSGTCDRCLFAPEEYTFYPAIYRSCSDVCNPTPGGPPKISPAEFTRRTKEGMVGREEIKTVSALILPAYVLPLLNILVTLMFIRSFSQMLGGDIEIPGLAKIL